MKLTITINKETLGLIKRLQDDLEIMNKSTLITLAILTLKQHHKNRMKEIVEEFNNAA